MSYDENGLGFAELMFLSINYPAVFETVLNAPDGEILALARKYIKAFNLGLVTN